MRYGELWTDAELQVSVEAYLDLLRLERSGVTCSEHVLTEFLKSGPLQHRNGASIRYRMRNISSVMRDRGWPTLSGYSPAPQVGSGVKARILAILDSSVSTALIAPPPDTVEPVREDALKKLGTLGEALADLEDEFAGIGHNRPPEAIDDNSLNIAEIIDARDDVRSVREELEKTAPDTPRVDSIANRLIKFGLKLAGWAGERLTKFTDAALVTLAPVVVVKVTNVLPLIADAIAAVTKFLHHLL
jgi:hypothetical protein